MTIIDSHHHFWKYNADEYAWLDDSMAALRRDFLPADLQSTLAGAGVDRAVTVQVRQSVEETEWMLELADQHDFVAGVVGWAPLCDPGVGDVLDKFAGRKKLKGIRHIVQGEPDSRFLLRDDFNRGIDALLGRGLVYDILIYERHLPVAIDFVDRHPNQRFVLDHIAKPRIRDNEIEIWRDNLRELARRENVACKLSGVATEADFHDWTEAQLQRYIEAALKAFGPRRIMFGSDWPVCLAAIRYSDWLAMVKRRIESYSETEREWILGRTAAEVYGL